MPPAKHLSLILKQSSSYLVSTPVCFVYLLICRQTHSISLPSYTLHFIAETISFSCPMVRFLQLAIFFSSFFRKLLQIGQISIFYAVTIQSAFPWRHLQVNNYLWNFYPLKISIFPHNFKLLEVKWHLPVSFYCVSENSRIRYIVEHTYTNTPTHTYWK